jgi:hypothetical protein
MTPPLISFALALTYKIFILLTGLCFAYFGFRLFLADKTANAGDLSFKYDKYLLNVKGGAPGLFYSLFGAILIIVSIVKGIHYDNDETGPVAPSPGPSAVVLPDHPPQ